MKSHMFFIVPDVILLVRLQGKFNIDHPLRDGFGGGGGGGGTRGPGPPLSSGSWIFWDNFLEWYMSLCEPTDSRRRNENIAFAKLLHAFPEIWGTQISKIFPEGTCPRTPLAARAYRRSGRSTLGRSAMLELSATTILVKRHIVHLENLLCFHHRPLFDDERGSFPQTWPSPSLPPPPTPPYDVASRGTLWAHWPNIVRGGERSGEIVKKGQVHVPLPLNRIAVLPMVGTGNSVVTSAFFYWLHRLISLTSNTIWPLRFPHSFHSTQQLMWEESSDRPDARSVERPERTRSDLW